MSNIIVPKFGGSSLADRKRVDRAIRVVRKDKRRRLVVVSAPGKAKKSDTKMTDYLIRIADGYGTGEDVEHVKGIIASIGSGLDSVVRKLHHELDARITANGASDYHSKVVAFGEYASAKLVTAIMNSRNMNAVFVDPAEIGFVAKTCNGKVQPDPGRYSRMGKNILELIGDDKIGVMSGFYLLNEKGEIVVFPRGGSDTSQGCAANAIDALWCENCTDVDGLSVVDPDIVENPMRVRRMTYQENRELTVVGGFKLEKSSVIPLMEKDIRMHIISTKNPDGEGTWIVCDRTPDESEYIIGVAHQNGFSRLRLYKVGMDDEVGFGRQALSVLEGHSIPYKQFPSNTDIATLVVHKSYLGGNKLHDVERDLKRELGVTITQDETVSLVVAAGIGMANHFDSYENIFRALRKARIMPKIIDMSSHVSISIGVPPDKGADAVRAIYNEFYPPKE